MTLKNIKFDLNGLVRDELFRQQAEKVKALSVTKLDQEAKPTTGEILKRLKDCFDNALKATMPTVDDTPVEAEGI